MFMSHLFLPRNDGNWMTKQNIMTLLVSPSIGECNPILERRPDEIIINNSDDSPHYIKAL